MYWQREEEKGCWTFPASCESGPNTDETATLRKGEGEDTRQELSSCGYGVGNGRGNGDGERQINDAVRN